MSKSGTKFLFSIIFLMVLATPLMAQRSVGIGTDTPNQNAILHLQSSDQGILVPRLTTSARQSLKDAINVSGNPSDNNGLLIYDLNENKFYYWKNKDWTAIAGSGVAGNQDLTSSKTDSEITIDISDGTGTTFSVEDTDADPTNEIQSITTSQAGSVVTLDISQGNSATFTVDDADADATNELIIQAELLVGTTIIRITDAGGETDIDLSYEHN